jgi:cytochrome c biogenesis protein ResB
METAAVRHTMKTNSFWTSLRRLLSSVKFAVTILSLITIASIIGTVIPQNLTPDEYIQRYGERFYALFRLLNWTNLYHSWWFTSLLVCLMLSLGVVTSGRFSLRLRSLGFVITHVSIIIIVIGAIIGSIFGAKGFLWLKEGQSSSVFYVKEKPYPLGFEVSLMDFNLEYYESEKSEISVQLKNNPNSVAQIFPAVVGQEFKIKGSAYKLEILQYIPDFVIDAETKEASSRSDSPNNPALKIALSQDAKDRKESWLFARFPGMHMSEDEPLEVVYNFSPPEIKDYKSSLEISENGEIKASRIIEVNHPFQYKGYTFYQSSYRPEDLTFTGLEVVKDPGIPLVYIGFSSLMVGLVFLFYVSPFIKKQAGRGAGK